jgi:glycerophosphoryl diester phosphodiesterase
MSFDLSWLTRRPIAHRGYHDLNKTCWENTLSAFQRAIDRNFAIECDVQIASDGQAVVFHDVDLGRLAGTKGLVREKTASELAKLSVGGTDDHVPSLAEMLELVGGRVPIVIELKATQGHDDVLVDTVATALRGYNGDVAIMSFAHWLVRQFPSKIPEIPGGLTAEGIRTSDIERHFSMLAHQISFVSFDVNELPNPFVTFVRDRLSMPVITWTVSDNAAVEATRRFADQMTFEGFDPDIVNALS